MTEELAGETGTSEAFEALLEFIKDNRGFDFTGYKRPSLRRRIEKRMEAVDIATFDEYHAYLEANGDEFGELFDTILINVTGFFRDPPAWEYLASDVIPSLLERRDVLSPIRIWSAGAASGEEAYTVAILFAEALGEAEFRDRVKVYATDVDEAALSQARHAAYGRRDLEGLTDELRERYFEQQNGNLVFRPDLRRAIIFGRHDLVRDPPISRIDLLLARNTLMYFNPQLQAKILADFHFALADDGYLFLGKSEMLLTRTKLFQPLDLKRRVFTKATSGVARRERGIRMNEDGAERGDHLVPAAQRLQEAGFESVPVAHLVVDRGGRLALANAHARRLFGITQGDLGRPLQDLEVSYRPIELRARIDDVHRDHHPVSVRDVEWLIGGESHWFDVQFSTLTGADGTELGIGISFTDVTRYRRLQEAVESSKGRLETAYEELQSTAEELETTNEELQSTNEELETTNEELQSTNEELETTNEELQSTNEELETMNDELRTRTEELHDANRFLEAILGSIGAGVVVVDPELVVRAWNEYATELWGLREDEVVGRHLANLDVGLPVDEVAPLIRRAMTDDRVVVELFDAVNRRGRAMRCVVRVSSLRSASGASRGAIVQMEEEAPSE